MVKSAVKVSIGGYNLRQYEEVEGRDYTGYEVLLYKNDILLAVVEDKGDGSQTLVSFDPNGRRFANNVQGEMELLLRQMEGVLEDGSPASDFIQSPEAAVEGFTELLIELNEIARLADKTCQRIPASTFYIVGVMGGSWFKRNLHVSETSFFTKIVQTESYDKAYQKLFEYAREQEAEDGKLQMAAVLRGKMDWNLTFADYVELNKP